MQWLLSNLNPMLSLKHDPKMAMAMSCVKKNKGSLSKIYLPQVGSSHELAWF
jgi:hypothetical protein